MASLATFQEHRPRLLAIAYRMLGSSAEAEDAVQDTWLRWQAMEEVDIRNAGAWLTTALSRLCIDRLTSARARRESYVGPWLPEPVLTSSPLDVESISIGFLVMLETLSPVERAVFILHSAFDYSHAEIASALGHSQGSVRQVFHRAKEHLAAQRPRFASTRDDHLRLLTTFIAALTTGDLPALQNMLAQEATLHADSNGKVRGAARLPVRGAAAVARFLLGLVANNPAFAALTLAIKDINGWPACVMSLAGQTLVVVTIETDGHLIHAVRNIVNPDKLALRSMS